MCCKCGVEVDSKCMVFVAAGWCTGELLTLDQTKMNLTCGNLEISLVLIGLGSKRIRNGLKKTGFMYLLDLFGKGGEGVV